MQRLTQRTATLLGLLALSLVAGPAGSGELPPAAKKSPLNKMSLSIGTPNKGSQVRAKKLRKSDSLVLREKSKDRNFGHPALVLMLQRSAKQIARSVRGARLVVGDLSSQTGGPLSGHHSHQSGRDADLAFYMRDEKGKLTIDEKFVGFDSDGKAKDGSKRVFDDRLNWLLVKSFAKDDRAGLAYIFVSRPLRARLLAFAKKHEKDAKLIEKAAGLFVQPDNAEPHDDHFHVRIRCPRGQEAVCVE